MTPEEISRALEVRASEYEKPWLPTIGGIGTHFTEGARFGIELGTLIERVKNWEYNREAVDKHMHKFCDDAVLDNKAKLAALSGGGE